MKILENISRVLQAPLLKFKLTPEFFNLIKQDVVGALTKNIDVGFSLAGAIYKGKEVELKTDFDNFTVIGQEFMSYFGNKDNDPVKFYVSESWVVEQREHDYNPLHVHSSFLSGIIYIEIPPHIGTQKDLRKRTQKQNVDGFIVFLDGYQFINIQPEEGWGFIFPSNIPHMVYPFSGDTSRISLSFNLEIDHTGVTQNLKIGFNFNKDLE